jgi:membrane protein YqaA with SNARE-associated domain
VAGAILGGAGMYALAAHNAEALIQVLTHVPLISPAMVQTVGGQLQDNGLMAMVTGPLEGIPYKVFAVQAGAHHLSLPLFLLMTIVARLERFLPVVVLCAVAGTVFRKIIMRYTPFVVGAYALLWIGIYVFYYLRFR